MEVKWVEPDDRKFFGIEEHGAFQVFDRDDKLVATIIPSDETVIHQEMIERMVSVFAHVLAVATDEI